MVEAVCPKCENMLRAPATSDRVVVICPACGTRVALRVKPRVPNWENAPQLQKHRHSHSAAGRPEPFSYQAAGAPPGMAARRRYARHEVKLPVRVRQISAGRDSSLLMAETFDISGGGASLVSSTPIAPRTALDLEIMLPDPRRNITVTAEVIHTRRVGSRTFIGCEFLGSDAEMVHAVNEALDSTNKPSALPGDEEK